MKRFNTMYLWLVVFLLAALPAWAQEAAEEAPADDTMALVLGGVLGIIGLGVVISRFTKTDKDDILFARLMGIFKSLKK